MLDNIKGSPDWDFDENKRIAEKNRLSNAVAFLRLKCEDAGTTPEELVTVKDEALAALHRVLVYVNEVAIVDGALVVDGCESGRAKQHWQDLQRFNKRLPGFKMSLAAYYYTKIADQ